MNKKTKKIQYELKKDELVGRGRYRIVRPVGRGGSGSVYLAVRLRDHEKAAVKATSRVSGMMEAEVMKRLSRPGCPGIPRLYDMEMRGSGRMLLIMEFVDGTDLRTFMNNLSETESATGGCLDADEVLNWSLQICGILSYLHQQTPPVIYRDLKPSNLMLDKKGNIFLVDFGSARYFKGNLREDTERLGTRGYAAPEQFGSMGESDARTDIYGFGKVLLQLAERMQPKREERSPSQWRPAKRAGRPKFLKRPVFSYRPDVRPALEQLAQWCCLPERDERPPDMKTVLSELENLQDQHRRAWKKHDRRTSGQGLSEVQEDHRRAWKKHDRRTSGQGLSEVQEDHRRAWERRGRRTSGQGLPEMQVDHRKTRKRSPRKVLVTAAAAVLSVAVFSVALRSFTGWAWHAEEMPSEETSAEGMSDRTSQQETKRETIAELNRAPADAQIYERMLDDALSDDMITEEEISRIEQCIYSVPKKNNSGGRTALELFKWKNPSASDQFLYEYGTACFFCLEGGRPKGEALLRGIRDEKKFPQAQRKLLHAIHTLETGSGEEIWTALSAFTMNASDDVSGEENEDVRPFYLESIYNEQISLIILSWAADASFELPEDEIDQFLEDMDNYVKEGDSSDFSDKPASQSGRDSEDETASRAGRDSEDETASRSGHTSEDETASQSGRNSEHETASRSGRDSEDEMKSEADNKKENGIYTMSTARRMLRTENEELLESIHSIRQSNLR